MKTGLAATIIFVFALTSCTNNTDRTNLLIGSWSGTEWLANGKPTDNDAKGTHFTFDDKGQYSFENAGNKQTGTYKLENDMLFTTPDKQNEIMVKIVKLTKDSLVFDMNRSGQPETLTLLKK